MRPNNAISTIAIKSKHILNDVLERIIIIETKFVQREDVVMTYLFDLIITTIMFIISIIEDVIDQLFLWHYLDQTPNITINYIH